MNYILSRTWPMIHYLSVTKRVGLSCDILKQIHLTHSSNTWVCQPSLGWADKLLSEELERVQEWCCRIIGILFSSLPSLSNGEATLHTLTNILKDSSSPLHGFLSEVSIPTNLLRRHREIVVLTSRTKRHEVSFIPHALKLFYIWLIYHLLNPLHLNGSTHWF